MLSLYHANDLESLGLLAAELLGVPPTDPFAPLKIVVPSQGIGRWLTLELARRHKIAMQLEVMLPASYIWQLSRKVLGALPETNAFNSEMMGWRIYDWLCEPSHLQDTPRLARYLEGADERRRLSLAYRIADVFDQYLLYRDDWLAAWERGETLNLGDDESWQAIIWQALTKDGHPHRARIFENLLARLNSPVDITGLADQLVIFGISSLSPHHMTLFQALAKHTDVIIFALNPCREAWGDIRDIRELAKLPAPTSDDWLLDVGHPLLASLGKQGRDFFDALFCSVNEGEGVEVGIYNQAERLPDESLLKAVQNDILCLRTRPADERMPLAPDDRSLEVHVCHSPLREVEVLHDQLLARFANDPTLTPDQVVVLTPDIERYAPYISAVFGTDKRTIPYSLADRSVRAEIPVLEAFLSLLNLPKSRFSAEEIMNWLEQPAIAETFGIYETDLPLLRDWLREASIRWGRDSEHRVQLKLPADESYSWQQGLDRLLLGFAAPAYLAGDQEPLLGSHWPLDAVEGHRSQLLGALAGFIARLKQWTQRLSQPRALSEWADELLILIESFFTEDLAEDALVILVKACNELREQAHAAGVTRPIPLALVRQRLVSALDQSSHATGFLTGAVTFCTMVPMRSLPFRWVCLLGLDDGALPRRTPAAGFDLISRHPRRGDRARRLDDRYLLLEILLSARSGLYLSYVGRSPRDNAELPPSVLVSELLDTLNQTAVTDNGQKVSERITFVHPLQPFSPNNFSRGDGFAAHWHRAATTLSEPATGTGALFDSLEVGAELLHIEPSELLQCMKHPARYLLEQRLGVRLAEAEQRLAVHEPFVLEKSNLYALRELALNAVKRNWSDESELKVAMASGLLPMGDLGKTVWGKVRSPIHAFAPTLFAKAPQDEPQPVPIEIKSAQVTVRGWLDGVTQMGLFSYRLRALKEWDLTLFWLRHLLLNAMRPGASEMLSPTNNWRLEAMDAENARALLEPWLLAFRQAYYGPLPFFTRASFAYAKALAKPSGKKDPLIAAMDNATTSWVGNEYFAGEAEDAYHRIIFRDKDALNDTFTALAVSLCQPIYAYLQES